MTKEERAEYMKRYRREHREQINANRRYYYKQNKEKFLEWQREYIKRHRDYVNERQRINHAKRKMKKQLLDKPT